MLTWEDCVEAQALHARGWSITAIAAHTGHDRKTIRAYLNGGRRPGERKPGRPEGLAEFIGYCRQRLTDDPHLWLTTLFEEVVGLGYTASYPAFTAAVRRHGLRPRCQACAAAKTRDRQVIDHPAGEETQWDWLELPDPPEHWGYAGKAHLLLGTLAHSSRWRGWLAETEDQPHLVQGLHQVATGLGGLSHVWRFDRMATVCHPGSGRITASFGPVAVHYQVEISICPSRHAWRKGVVEKSAHTIAQRWWRTLADDATVATAQARLDRLCAPLDGRRRARDGAPTSAGAMAAPRARAHPEPLRAMPAPFPAVLEVGRTVGNQALVAFGGNRYSVPPGRAGDQVTVRHTLGAATVDIVDGRGGLLAHHVRQPDGAGMVVRDEDHVAAMTKVVLGGVSDREPCRRKTRRPPSAAARAQAERIRRARAGDLAAGDQVVIDFADYARAARPLRGQQAGEQ